MHCSAIFIVVAFFGVGHKALTELRLSTASSRFNGQCFHNGSTGADRYDCRCRTGLPTSITSATLATFNTPTVERLSEPFRLAVWKCCHIAHDGPSTRRQQRLPGTGLCSGPPYGSQYPVHSGMQRLMFCAGIFPAVLTYQGPATLRQAGQYGGLTNDELVRNRSRECNILHRCPLTS